MNSADIRSLLTFLREFADGCHPVKEEAVFFPALMQAGMSVKQGPLLVMNYEHERGRGLTAAMQDAIDRKRMHDFLMYSSRYVELLSQHIEKENWVLFDKADQITWIIPYLERLSSTIKTQRHKGRKTIALLNAEIL